MGIANIQPIPQELVDIIIDYLHNDNDTLCTCALVCKHWIPSSRVHLPIKIMAPDSDDQAPDSYVDFLQLLDTPGCTFVPFLRRLAIEDQRDHCFQSRQVLHLIHRLPALHSISIQLWRYDATWHEAPDLFSGLTLITDVTIGGTCFNDPNDFFDLACSFPSLRSLHITDIDLLDKDLKPSSRVPIPRTLRYLHVETIFNYEQILHWLISNDKMPAFDTVRMDHVAWPELDCVGNFLGKLGGSLLHLELDFWSEALMMDGSIGDIDLSPNTNLRYLAIYSTEGDFVENHLINRGYLAKLLSRISSTYVEILIFQLELTDIDDIQPDVWADIDRILEKPQFSCLKKLLLTLDSCRFDDLAESVRQRLPGCHKRGTLVFNAPGK